MPQLEPKELYYTGLTPTEYIQGESCKCVFCKGANGDKEVAELDGDAVEVRIEIEHLVFETGEGFRTCYPVCLKCRKFLEGLISVFDETETQKALKKLLPLFAFR